MPGQQVGGVRPDVPDAEREKQRAERLLLRRGDRVDQLLRRLLREALDAHQLFRRDRVDVRDVPDQLLLEQQPHALVAQAADVHRAARREVHDSLEQPAGAGHQDVDTRFD